MNIYKEYMYNIRKMECETPFLIVIREHPPTFLYGYIRSLMAIPFLESCYNLYYGELRKIIYSFLNYYTICTGHAVKEGEDKKNTLQYNKMMQMFNKTVVYHELSHEQFLKEFQPIESAEEQEKFDTIVSQYNTFKANLLQFGEKLKTLNKQDKIDNFAKDHFTIGPKKFYQIFDYTHVFIAKWLEDHTKEIRISLEDILHRMRTNYAEYKKEHEDHLNGLYNELYELNKEKVLISRQEHQSTQEAATNKKNIATIKNKIQSFGNHHSFTCLKEEVEYWSRRLTEFEEITTIITKIKTPLEKTKTEEKIHSRYETIDLPDTNKYECWHRMGHNLVNYRTDLEKKYIEACRPLLTFFSSRGVDRILYSDNIGSFYMDEYGHQNYITHYGAKFCHVGCEGQYIEMSLLPVQSRGGFLVIEKLNGDVMVHQDKVNTNKFYRMKQTYFQTLTNNENDKYYFDKNGRYVLKDGKKVYQLAPCTSYNNLTENGLWRNIDPCDCKDMVCWAKVPFGTCSVQIRDLTDVVLLPRTDIIDIEKTLDSDSVKYLWDTYGWILPEILNDVGLVKPKNPIHYLAHLLLNKSHSITAKDIKARRKEAIKYRDDIVNQRKKEAEARARAWQAKQVKPSKDTDGDTSLHSTAYKAFQDSQQLTADLSMYYTY